MDLLKASFLGSEIVICKHNNLPYVAMRSITEGIGLDWESQRQRIARHEVLGSTACMIKAVAQDGKQRELLCLPLEYLSGWLFSIDLKRVKPALKEKLKQYQIHCYQALWQYWTTGMAKRDDVLERLKVIADFEKESKKRGSDAGKKLYQRKIEKHAIEHEMHQIHEELKQFELFIN